MTDAGAQGLPQAAPGEQPGAPAAQALFNPFGTLGVVTPAHEQAPAPAVANANAVPSVLAILVLAIGIGVVLRKAAD